MSISKKAIVLCGINAHIELINNLKQRGFQTILVDYAENPLAKNYADIHLISNAFDKEIVMQLAQEYNVDLVISVAADHANVVACYVSEKLGLPLPYSYKDALLISDKKSMKKELLKNGIPTAQYHAFNNLESLIDLNINFPAVVKPSDGYGSKGVRKAHSMEELLTYAKLAFDISKTKRIIIEEFIEGREFSVYCFVKDGEIYPILYAEKFRILDQSGDSVLQSVGSIAPATNILRETKEKIIAIIKNLAKSFNLLNTPLLVQFIMNENNDIKVLEFMPRIGGGLSFRTIKLSSGFDILDATIDTFVEKITSIEYREGNELYAIINLYAKAGIFGRLEGHEKLICDNMIHELYINKLKGEKIGHDMSSSDRIGQLIIKAKNKNELIGKISYVLHKLEIYDSKGKSIKNISIYKNILKN